MSRWTVSVRRMVELNPFVNSTPGKPDELSACVTKYCRAVESGQNMWLKNYPIYDESHRQELNEKIINYYLFNEIGLETVSLWNYRFEEKMKRIMPRYNLMYKAYAEDFNLLENFSTTKQYTLGKTGNNTESKNGTNTNERNQNSSVVDDASGTASGSGNDDTTITNSEDNNTTNDSIYSEFPQSNISSGDYATNETKTENTQHSSSTGGNNRDYSNTASSTSKNTQTGEQTDKNNGSYEDERSENFKEDNQYQETTSGFNQYPVEMLMKYLEFINNVDELIIKELGDLFMLIY